MPKNVFDRLRKDLRQAEFGDFWAYTKKSFLNDLTKMVHCSGKRLWVLSEYKVQKKILLRRVMAMMPDICLPVFRRSIRNIPSFSSSPFSLFSFPLLDLVFSHIYSPTHILFSPEPIVKCADLWYISICIGGSIQLTGTICIS